MERGRILGVVLLAAVTAGAIGYAASRQAEERAAAETAYQAYLDALPLAEAEGETCSPNGRFQVRTAGESDLWIGGVRIPEALEIVDTETGEVRWEDTGYVRQSVLWSPGNNLVAMACGARTWGTVYVVSTAFWTTWEFTLPDGTSIPDYTFLPEDWGRWLDENTLLVTVGQGGDAGEQHTYRCILRPGEDGTLSGSVQEQTTEVPPGAYDFDHDGTAETVEVTTVLDPENEGVPVWHELRISDGERTWTEGADHSHAGAETLCAVRLDGEDCLLRYVPYMGQGYCTYHYEIFSLDDAFRPVTLRENSVEFDLNWDQPWHTFDTEAVAAFLVEIHGLLDGARPLLDTGWGELPLGEGVDYGDTGSVRAHLEALAAESRG